MACRPGGQVHADGKQFSEGLKLAKSIDSYIYTHQHDPNVALCGKMGIVYTILSAEKNSSLYLKHPNPSERINLNKLESTWYVQFAKILFGQVPLDEFIQIL